MSFNPGATNYHLGIRQAAIDKTTDADLGRLKRERQDKKKHHRNIARTSEMKTIIKTVMEEKKLSKAENIYNVVLFFFEISDSF